MSLTGSSDGGERRRGGGATALGGGGPRLSPAARCGEGGGRVRRGMRRGEGGDAPGARNRREANQGRRIGGGNGVGGRPWGVELGFAGRRKDEAAASSWRIRASGGVKRWHGSRGWPARGSAGRRRRRVRRAASETERGEGRGLTGGPGRGK